MLPTDARLVVFRVLASHEPDQPDIVSYGPDVICEEVRVHTDSDEGAVEGFQVVAVFPPVEQAQPDADGGYTRYIVARAEVLTIDDDTDKFCRSLYVAFDDEEGAVEESEVVAILPVSHKWKAAMNNDATAGPDGRDAGHQTVPPPPAAPASPPAPHDTANKSRVEALAAHWNASHRPGGSPTSPTPPTVPPMTYPPPTATRPTTPPTYFDCPICGHPFVDDSYTPGKAVGCPQCGNEFAAATGLNRRTTPQPVEARGFLGQLLWGKTVQTPLRKKLMSTIRMYESMASSAAASGNFEQAQFYQMRAMDARRQLENT